MTKTLTRTKDFAAEYTLASKRKNLTHLQNQLTENGKFNIQTEDLFSICGHQ